MSTTTPVITAVSSSTRHIQMLLRCISFAKKAQVRIYPGGLRFSTDEGSVMEAFVFLDKTLFTTYSYNAPATLSSQEDNSDPPVFEINLASLLETLNIFALSDPNSIGKKSDREYDAFAAHRLGRHAGLNTAFSTHTLGMTGLCTIAYSGEGNPLSVHMSESGVTTTCDLTTYEADRTDEIPFNRADLAVKTIMRSSSLLDAINELSSISPINLTIIATPTSRANGVNLSLIASGALGSVAVDFIASPTSSSTSDGPPILETFHCPAPTRASFRFGLIQAAQRAMAAATKVSMRLDHDGVLSLQFLVEVGTSMGTGGANGSDDEGVAFVDFRIVPLVEEEEPGSDDDSDGSDDD